MAEDPFDLSGFRAATLRAWQESPTRLTEDTNTERDLVEGGYRDRVLVELAQNGADAAARAGEAGHLRVTVAPKEFRVANTGAPLTADGVASLLALRASAKDGAEGQVGRFGVGFVAAVAAGDEITVASTSGALRFSADETREAIAAQGISIAPGVPVPVTRLAWPASEAPPKDFATEVTVRLREPGSVDVTETLEQCLELLVELPTLRSIELAADGEVRTLERTESPSGVLTDVTLTVDDAVRRRYWQYDSGRARWLVPTDGDRVVALDEDYLRAPTRSDELLSLPAVLVAQVPLTPDRRHLAPDVDLRPLAAGYADLVAAIPVEERTKLVPAVRFPRSHADDVLREALWDELRNAPWLPTVDGGSVPGSRARVVEQLDADLAEVLEPVLGDLVVPELSGRLDVRAMAPTGVTPIGLAELAELLGSVAREPAWYRELYDAIEPLVTDGVAAEELSTLPVPLADGRIVTGVRGVISLAADGPVRGVAGVDWVRLVHPDADHRLLARLGAGTATPADLLREDALRVRVEDAEDLEPEAFDELISSVLALVAQTDDVPEWLGRLPLTDANGYETPADELFLPGAPLLEVLTEDAPIYAVDAELVERFGAETLRKVGVAWGPVSVSIPDVSEEDLATFDEAQAWADDRWERIDADAVRLIGNGAGFARAFEERPPFRGIRDLEWIAGDKWRAALELMVADDEIREQLRDGESYTAWWLRRHAEIDGVPLGMYVGDDSHPLASLLPQFRLADPDDTSVLAGVLFGNAPRSRRAARWLLEALAMESLHPTPFAILVAHTMIGASGYETLAPEVDHMRGADGALHHMSDLLVLDDPQYGVVAEPGELVLTGSAPSHFAMLVDLPTVTDRWSVRVLHEGRAVDPATDAALVEAALLTRWPDMTLPARSSAVPFVDGVNWPAMQVHEDGVELLAEDRWGEHEPRHLRAERWEDEATLHVSRSWIERLTAGVRIRRVPES